MKIVDETIAEELEIVEEVIRDEIKPIIDYRKNLENKIFNKAYKEVLDLEKGV